VKIAYVTTYDPTDLGPWSGLGAYICKSLRAQGFEVDCLGPLPKYSHPHKHWLRAKRFWYNHLLRHRLGFFSPERDHQIAQVTGRQILEKLNKRSYDLIVSPGAPAVAYLETDVPIVIWTDATFRGLVTTYPEYKKQTRGYYRDGDSLDQKALRRAALCLFSNEWAANSAIEEYGIEPSKVKVVPFGANVEDDLQSEDLRAAIAKREPASIRLLFVGVDFARKGGAKVFDVLSELLRLGTKADLRIVGCDPDVPEELKPHTQVLGFISKKTPEGRCAIKECYLTSHWLILLSSAECCAVALAEANCFGVPAIATRVGGNATIVTDNRNGKLFDVSGSAAQIADYLAQVSRHPNRYTEMAVASREEYRNRLNWGKAGLTFASLVDTYLKANAG
jgi:glycosyltransferase involved in cell wall biosynthesis